MTLASCPCGEVPTQLFVFMIDTRSAIVFGSCCNKWGVHFLVPEGEYGTDTSAKLSTEAWNAAPRKRSELPEILFDGYAVYSAVNNIAKERISHRVVSDVLDAVVKLIRQGKTDQRSEL